MLTFTNLVSRVCSRLNKNPNDATAVTRIKNHINDVCLEKWHGYNWSFREREYPLVLSPRVTSGTMTATNASQAVTASGTPFLSTHVGAWIRFTADTYQAWYKIIAVGSTSTATIEPAYQGTTGSSKAYELVKTDYLLPMELSDIASVKVHVGGHSIVPTANSRVEEVDFPPLGTGYPESVRILSQSQTYSTYTTGTVSGTAGTTTLTGVGTAWLSNVTPGDEIVIDGDTNTYKVHSVVSDTQLNLYNFLGTTAATDTYIASRRFGKLLRIWPATDNAYVVFITGLRAYANLVSNSDSNELLVRYPHAVIEGAVWREASSSPDSREDALYMKSEGMWAKAQGEDEQLHPHLNYHPIWNSRQEY